MKSIIEIFNLSKNFDNKNILKKINLKITKGESLVIIGKSGSGKSLLMKCVLGILKPSQGEILIKNKNFFSIKRDEQDLILKSIGVTFQGNALFDSMRIWENISFKLSQNNFFKFSQLKEKVEFSLNQVGLSNSIMYQFPSQLSGGMQKRVAIARAVVMNPKYLFCDEPNSGLDPKTAIVIDQLIQEITKEYNITTIINSHDMNSVIEIGENIVFLKGGYKIWQGTNKEILKSTNKEVEDFVYSSELLKKLRN